METLSLSHSQVPGASGLLLDYLSRYDRVQGFYNGSPFERATYERIANELRNGLRSDRKALAEILLRQNQSFGVGQETFDNIRRLTAPDAVAVVTGQQVGLLSGPAFTLYKALTAIRLSQSLNAQGLNSVPVFWLATEDHDLEEVAQTYAFKDEYELIHLSDPGERPAPQSPVGRVQLTEKVAAAIDQLQGGLPPSEFRDRTIEELRASYQPGVTWGQAFGRFLARLFKQYGVVFLDPLDEGIHRLNVPVYHEAARRAAELRARLMERSQAIVKAGYHAQVRVSEESTLLFAERDGNRLPLHQYVSSKSTRFLTEDSEGVAAADLESEIENQPIHFSSNVLLRPIIQDMLLPTVAYVAGPSELAYLGQAAVLYPVFGRPMPAIFPRAGFTLVDHHVERWMEKYRLSVEDVWQGEERLGRRIAETALAEGWPERFDQTERDLGSLLERLRKDVESLDPTLLDALKRAEEKILYQIERLKGKMTRSALGRSEVLARHRESLLRAIMPKKDLQERVVSGAYFLGRAGYGLLDRLLERIPTDSSTHCVLSY